MPLSRTDILVIGGGPAGSTIGTLLAENGWDVTLLEKNYHPRFHIGESLLPMNLPILDDLGVLEDVKSIGVAKMGADFTVGNSGEKEKTFYFKDALGESPPQAFEVRRAEFDELLYRRCERAGVDSFEGMQVNRVTQLDDGTCEVEARDTKGDTHHWAARYLVDASGRDTFMATANGWKRKNSKHASAAVFGHFRAVDRRPGEDQGNISLYWFENGWIWMIPLQDDIMSIGAVCRPEHLKTRSGSLDGFLRDTLDSVAEVNDRMKRAEPVIEACATGNYSYLSDRMCGPGYLMIGDAFAFIDPVFSSGVYLAMNSAKRGVQVVEAWMNGSRAKYSHACRRYEKETRRGLTSFSWFIYRFTSPTMAYLMSNPRNVGGIVQSVISMLAGDVYANRSVRLRLLIFKAIYGVSSLINWREALAYRRLRSESIRQSTMESG